MENEVTYKGRRVTALEKHAGLPSDLLKKFRDLSEAIDETDLDEHDVVGLLFGDRCERESRGRERLVKSVIEAKREFGATGLRMKVNFFDEIWPVVFRGYLRSKTQAPD